MVSEHQVRCINKVARYNPHERITHIGELNDNGSRWRLTQKEAIDGIKAGKWAFYVMQFGRKVKVVVATNNGNEYLKTEADTITQNNLLSLPECPSA